MITLRQPIDRRQFTEPLQAIQDAAEAVVQASLPELRAQIDATHTFVAEEFIPNAQAEERATATRLVDKLLALRERLVYSDFGPAEQHALRGVLYDLAELVELHAVKGGAIPTAQIPAADQTRFPPPPNAATTSQGSYFLRWMLYRGQGTSAAADAQAIPEGKPKTATKL